MLDDQNTIKQRDPKDALGVAAREIEQLTASIEIENPLEGFRPTNIVIAGMGGSALAAGMVKSWMNVPVPFEVVRAYEVPAYVDETTLVIASSYSGNTEETLSALANAEMKGAKIAVIAAGGRLAELARKRAYSLAVLPASLQPRMAVLHNLRALARLLESFSVVSGKSEEIAANAEWLAQEVENWKPEVATTDNYAKQLALEAVGKTPVIYAGSLMASLAYKWKIGFNENAKNLAFYNELPEFNHNEFMGWTSHPIEKPFAIFNLVSSFEHPQILRRFEVSDRLLSGKRPHAITVNLKGDNVIGQMLWAGILGDFVSIYVATLNNVDPTPVDLIEKLKKELA
jgi:glucose/mannose-6-phosphate isomerase